MILLVLFGLVGLGGTAVAQETGIGARSEFFAKTFYILKIAPHNLGYRVNYLTTGGQSAVTYLPIEWFTAAAGKAELIESNGAEVPYMTIFWKNGEFSHLRLFVVPNYGDPSWAAFPSGVNPEEEFAIDTLALHFNQE
jgi:hypothetical protein